MIAVALRARGVDVCHVRDRDLLGASDAVVLERALEEDRILVTINVLDFEKLAKARDLHAGIVLVERSGLLRDEQAALLDAVLSVLEPHGPMVNEVLHVALDGSMTFETLPR